jgi:hypothetical protein
MRKFLLDAAAVSVFVLFAVGAVGVYYAAAGYAAG